MPTSSALPSGTRNATGPRNATGLGAGWRGSDRVGILGGKAYDDSVNPGTNHLSGVEGLSGMYPWILGRQVQQVPLNRPPDPRGVVEHGGTWAVRGGENERAKEKAASSAPLPAQSPVGG